jgi:Putative carbonic anhydrase
MTRYASSLPFDEIRIHAAAVYCSDGRFGEQFDDMLQTHLQLPKYDRLALPGGPGCFADHYESHREAEAAAEELKFLVNVHELERLILIAHQNCAYYAQYLKVPLPKIEEQQRLDLNKAVDRVLQIAPALRVEAFFARVSDRRVVFERVDTPGSSRVD